MKLTREKKIILLAALFGAMFALRSIQLATELGELSEAIEAKGEEKQPFWLRRRYVPVVEREKVASEF